jgi:hypothetical protein
MLPEEAISTFISAVNSRIPPPVHTAGIENERPVPAVIIDGMSIEEQNHHNEDRVGAEYNSNGNVTKEIFRHYYDLRLELTVRDDDEVKAYDYLGQLQRALAELGRDPCNKLHEHVHEFDSLGSGGISYQFYEPVETEINQSVVLKTFYESYNSNPDVLTNIGTDYTFS